MFQVSKHNVFAPLSEDIPRLSEFLTLERLVKSSDFTENPIALFLDIDDTIGKCIYYNQYDYNKYVERIHSDPELVEEDTFLFHHVVAGGDRNTVCEYRFRFRPGIRDVFRFVKENRDRIPYVALFSASCMEYIESIRAVLEKYYEFPVEEAISTQHTAYEHPYLRSGSGRVCMPSQYRILMEMCEDPEQLLWENYAPKNTVHHLRKTGRWTDKTIPILVENNPFWSVDGYHIGVREYDGQSKREDAVIQVLQSPICRSNGLLLGYCYTPCM